jgi:hypothetical protein
MKYTGTNTTLLAFEASGDYDGEDNFTDAQKETIFKVVDKYKFIEGNYSSTMIQGVGHAYCDSGILSDGWAVEDVEILSEYLRSKVASTVGKKNEYGIVDETSVVYGTDIVHTCGDAIINMHTDGKRTHMWDTLFIADMETALGNDKYNVEGVNVDELGKGKYEGYIDTEAWASYAWELESYMYEQHIKK